MVLEHNEYVAAKMRLCHGEIKRIKDKINTKENQRRELVGYLVENFINLSKEEREKTEEACYKRAEEIARLEKRLMKCQEEQRYIIWEFLPTDTPFKRQH